MSLFWYPELNSKFEEGMPDKGILLSSYIRYFLARLQSMFKYEGLPDSIPQKWLENYLLVNGLCLWIKNGDDLIVTDCGVGASPDVYYIPTKAIVSNPYVEDNTRRTYTRDVDCVLMVNDTYAQGLLPLLRKYCSMLVENDITMNIAGIMSRATIILTAADDKTKASAELFIKHLLEGKLDVIGETPFLLGNQDKSLSINEMTRANDTLTQLIEYHQYIKASLFNDLGLQSNYNMKRESINSNESQLNEDMLHPLIDNMLAERKAALEKVNEMFGTNITVEFNSAWALNERQADAEIETVEAEAEAAELAAAPVEDITAESVSEDVGFVEDTDTETETISNEEFEEDGIIVQTTITQTALNEIADAVAEKMEGENEDAEKTE